MTQSERPNTDVKRRRKRLVMPPPIPDTLENVAKAVLSTPPKKRGEWQFLKEHKRQAKGQQAKQD